MFISEYYQSMPYLAQFIHIRNFIMIHTCNFNWKKIFKIQTKWGSRPQINSTYSEIFLEFASSKICVSVEKASFVIGSLNLLSDEPRRLLRNFLSDSWHFNIKKWALFIWWEQNGQIFCGKLSLDEIYKKKCQITSKIHLRVFNKSSHKKPYRNGSYWFKYV